MASSLSKLVKLAAGLRSRRAGIAAMVALIVAILYRIFIGPSFSFDNSAPYSEFHELTGVRLPQYSAFTPSFLSSIWPLITLGLLLSLVAFRFVKTIATAQARVGMHDDESRGQSGTSAVEFVMLLPLLVALLLMILQIALIVQAKFVVNYAAFSAARSAIVIIPDSFGGTPQRPPESRNQLANPSASQKMELIQRAAALPVTAVSPPGVSLARGWSNPLAGEDLLLLSPFDVAPHSMMGEAIVRAPYAYDKENTAVKVLTPQGWEGGSFKDHDWVTVKVRYRYYLTVPFANKLFGTAYSGNPIRNFLFGTDYYYPIVEQYTLPMDGEPNGL